MSCAGPLACSRLISGGDSAAFLHAGPHCWASPLQVVQLKMQHPPRQPASQQRHRSPRPASTPPAIPTLSRGVPPWLQISHKASHRETVCDFIMAQISGLSGTIKPVMRRPGKSGARLIRRSRGWNCSGMKKNGQMPLLGPHTQQQAGTNARARAGHPFNRCHGQWPSVSPKNCLAGSD